jgi:hypothetical protein
MEKLLADGGSFMLKICDRGFDLFEAFLWIAWSTEN